MKVTRGFSEEISHCVWAKADIELDEGDLERMLLDRGFDVATRWEELTSKQVYGILSTEAERLCYVSYVKARQAHKLEITEAMYGHLKSLTDVVVAALDDVAPRPHE